MFFHKNKKASSSAMGVEDNTGISPKKPSKKPSGKSSKMPSGNRSRIPRTEAPFQPVEYGGELSYRIGNLQGIGARQRQEDSFCIVNAIDHGKMKKHGLFFAVCDGMGGMKDGKIASETAVACLRGAYERMDKTEDMAVLLKKAVCAASNEVEGLLEGQGGSTVVAGILFNDLLYYISVGDSCFYLKRDGHLYRLNREHNLRNEIYLEDIRKGIIDPTDGRQDPESAALTQFLGMSGFDETDGSVRPLPMKAGDVLLACSDGVGGTLSETQLLDALEGDDPVLMCRNLEDEIVACFKPHQDNYTAVVVKCIF